MIYNTKSELEDAIAAGKNNKLLEWTIAYLQKDVRNKNLVEDIQKRKIIKTELIKYPLSKLSRVTGPQNGEAIPEPLPHWLKRVKEIRNEITKKQLPPPIIVTDFWQELEIADGSHRHEALLKHGITDYWTIFLFVKDSSMQKLYKKIKNSRKIKGIITDVGGVLVQTVNIDKRRIWENKLHLSPGQLTREVYSRELGNSATIGQVSSDYIWQDIKKRFNLNTKDLEQLQSDFYSGDLLNIEFYNYIKHVREKCKIVILSEAWDNARAVYKERYRLDKIADKMILSSEEGLRKTDEQFIMLASRFLDISPVETLYIDDTPPYLLQAKTLGFNTILFTDTASVIAQIKAFL